MISFVLGADLIEVVKTASSGASMAGDTVTFTMEVENTSAEPLTGVAISEDVLERADGTPLSLTTGPDFVSSSGGSPEGTLAVGETATYEATYTLVQEDIDAGGISNQATGVGTASTGEFSAVSRSSAGGSQQATVVTIAASPSYDFIKESAHDDADGNGRVDAGETINYTFTIENTGNVTLTDVVVTDSRAVLSGSPIAGPLAPGAVDATSVTGTYTVTQADIEAGDLDNLASATAKDPGGNDVTVTSRPPGGTPGDPTGVPGFAQVADYDFIKEAAHDDANGNGLIDAGEELSYTFTVENTGNVSLTNVAVTDSRATVSGSPIAGPLAPGAVDTTSVTGTYTVTQADIDAGNLDNVADATAKDPGGNDVNKQSRPPSGNPGDPTSPPGGVNKVADYDFVKDVTHVDADGNGLIDAGERLDYTFTVENTGNVTLTDVAVTDSRATVSGSPIATLAPGAVDATSVTGTYTVTQADIDAGNLDNLADAVAKDPDGNDVIRQSRPPSGNPGDPTRPPGGVTQVADYDFVKEVTHDDADGNGRIDVGEKLVYIFTVANTGNVTLTNVTVTDSRATVSGSPIPSLAPGQVDSTSVTGVYFVTQDDIDAGTIANVADANAKDPNGGDVPKRSRPPGGSPGDSTDLPVDADASVDFVKEATLEDADGDGFADAGERVVYAFTVTNTGNVTVHDVTVEDDRAEVTGGPISLAPGQVDATSFTGHYVITQADIDSGSFANVATVNGKAPNGDDVTAVSRPPEGVPGDQTVIPFAPNPAIELELTGSVVDADGDGFPDAGEAVAYRFTVRNTGNVTLSNITIPSFDVELKDAAPASAAAIRPLALVPVGGTLASLAPGAEDAVTFASSYPLAQADIDAGRLDAVAVVSGSAPNGDAVTDMSDDPAEAANADPEGDGEPDDPTVLLLPQNAVLALEKSGIIDDADGNGFADPGEGILYSFTVENTGNVTVDDVTPSDPGPRFDGHAPAGSLSSFDPGPVRLAPGQAQVFTATYSLAEADLDHVLGVEEGVVNEAAATGRAARDGGEVVSPPASAVLTLPGFAITKTARQKQVMRGGRVPYTITVRSLTDGAATGTVVDQMPSGFAFLEGSASVDGVAFAPEVEGQFLTFKDLTIAADADTVIELSLVASASAKPGKYVNRARVLAPNGRPLTRDATATVEVVVEPVFDCGDVIGKVFDDANRNGYQDDGERGLPGVRVATVSGLLITTDRHGRFHVACADLPDQRIGSTFIMKLDPRTLPTGYRMVSENPRTVRLTAGKASRLNFAAAIGRLVRLDLTAEAFEPGSTALRPEWEQGLGQLIALLSAEPSTLRLAYIDQGTDRRTAAKRTKAVRKLIQHRWKQSAPKYTLHIETRVQTGQSRAKGAIKAPVYQQEKTR
ncbi:DUF7507 domain-containing protein [Nitratireductor thuwali]|uniref:DUF7507 domain-containing protein n=1 Tax=Nitratireductor thuwali TaxID=2267699 RepID=UPI0030CBCBB9